MPATRSMIHQVVPARDVAVRIKVDTKSTVARVYLAPENVDLDYTLEDGVVSVTVPEVAIHSMVVVEFE